MRYYLVVKINLHERGKEFEPKAQHARTGSADLCFIVETPLTRGIAELNLKQVKIIEGPVIRTGAQGLLNLFIFMIQMATLLNYLTI